MSTVRVLIAFVAAALVALTAGCYATPPDPEPRAEQPAPPPAQQSRPDAFAALALELKDTIETKVESGKRRVLWTPFEVAEKDEAAGRQIETRLMAEMLRLGVDIVDRRAQDATIRELELAEKGVVDPATGPHPQRLQSAPVMLRGHVFLEPGRTVLTVKLLSMETAQVISGHVVRLE